MLSETATPAHGEFSPPRLFISYSRSDGRAFAEKFEERIASEGLTSWRDLKSVEGGEDIRPQVLSAIEAAEHLVLVLTRRTLESDWVKREWSHARAQGVKVSPVLGDPALRKDDLPAWARRADVYDISEPERWTKLVAVLKGPGATRRVPYMKGYLPASFVPRPTEFERLKQLVLAPEGGAVGLSTALSGAGGYGKTTLANALCRDGDVRFEFSDGIVRVEIGKEREGVLGLISDVIETLDPDGRRPGFQDETMAAEHLSEVLGEARVLLVLDDVWRESHLRPFLLGGPNCARLITTRRPDLLPDGFEAVDVDELRAEESLALLTWEIPVDATVALWPRLDALGRRLEGWAQMLEIANGWLRDRLRRGENPEAALGRFEGRLERCGLAGFDPKDPDARNRAVALCVDASLEDLDEAERARFEELAVIPEDVDAPMETVARFWERTGGLDEDEAEDVLERLASLSLVQELDLAGRTLRLHDNMKWLLRDRIGPERLAAAHGAMACSIIDAARGEWARLPADHRYGWMHGLFHLRQAGDSEADSLLKDYSWIKARLAATGAQGLREAWLPEPEDAEARMVGRAVALSVPALSRRPEQLPAQLWGRLGRVGTPGVAALCAELRADPSFWPKPHWPGLTPPGAELLRFVGHTGKLSSAVFSPNDLYVLTASLDGTARLWHAKTGEEIAVLRGHRSGVRGAVFSPDGKRILTASEDGSAKLWNAETGAESARLGGHEGWVYKAVFSSDGARALTASVDGTARLWNLDILSNALVLRGHEDWVWSAVFSPDGSRALTASEDGSARLWDTETALPILEMLGHKGSVRSAVFSPDGALVLTASVDGTARIWDSKSGTEIAVLRGHQGWVVSAVFSPDGNRILTASDDRTARLWEASGVELAVFEGHQDGLTGAAFSKDGGRLLTTSLDGTVRVWDSAGEETAVLHGHGSWIWSAEFSRDGARVLSASDDRTARLWDTDGWGRRTFPFGHDGGVSSVEFSPNGMQVLTGSLDGTARLWSVENGQEEAIFRGHEGWVVCAVFSPSGRWVLTASDDRTARLWDVASGVETALLRAHEDALTCAAFAPDGTRLLTASRDGTARLFDVETAAEIAVLRGHAGPIFSAVFSQDGSWILTASGDRTARLWDAGSATEVAMLQGHTDGLTISAFSPDGARALTASRDGTARLWNIETITEIAVLRGHAGPIFSAVFSQNGSRVLTASSDGEARLWCGETGHEHSTFSGHEGAIWGVAFAVFTPSIVTASDDGTVRTWDAATGAEEGCVVLDTGATVLASKNDTFAFGDRLGRLHVCDLNNLTINRAGME